MKTTKTIFTWLSYPVRYLLRHRVENCKEELSILQGRQQELLPLARRNGKTNTVASAMLNNIVLMGRYERFIERWSL